MSDELQQTLKKPNRPTTKQEQIIVSCKTDFWHYLRNKSWKPECVGSFNMDWRILVFYPEPEAGDTIY
jgi:hypothetical protein